LLLKLMFSTPFFRSSLISYKNFKIVFEIHLSMYWFFSYFHRSVSKNWFYFLYFPRVQQLNLFHSNFLSFSWTYGNSAYGNLFHLLFRCSKCGSRRTNLMKYDAHDDYFFLKLFMHLILELRFVLLIIFYISNSNVSFAHRLCYDFNID
jgi:hypothetical protein